MTSTAHLLLHDVEHRRRVLQSTHVHRPLPRPRTRRRALLGR